MTYMHTRSHENTCHVLAHFTNLHKLRGSWPTLPQFGKKTRHPSPRGTPLTNWEIKNEIQNRCSIGLLGAKYTQEPKVDTWWYMYYLPFLWRLCCVQPWRFALSVSPLSPPTGIVVPASSCFHGIIIELKNTTSWERWLQYVAVANAWR